MSQFSEITPVNSQGYKVWRNPKNRFVVVELHYTADPRKRDPSWIAAARAGMPKSDWEREYELSWETFEGKPVHPDFKSRYHIWEVDVLPSVGLPIVRGWDSSGLSPAVAIMQLVGRRCNVLDEIIGDNTPAVSFVPEVIEYCGRNFGNYTFIDIVDPAGFAKSPSDMRSYCGIMIEHGLSPIPGPKEILDRETPLNRRLVTIHDGFPLIMLNPRCKTLKMALAGGYNRDNRGKPTKNEFSHIAEGLQYGVARLEMRGVRGSRPSMGPIARPSYGNVR